jgi:hypothetical protein
VAVAVLAVAVQVQQVPEIHQALHHHKVMLVVLAVQVVLIMVVVVVVVQQQLEPLEQLRLAEMVVLVRHHLSQAHL